MFDIHNHIVPGVDDGAATVEISLNMLRQARDIGITGVLTTPHVRGDREGIGIHRLHKERFELLKSAVEDQAGLDIELFLSGEVRATHETGSLITEKSITVNEAGKYILLELPFEEAPKYIPQLLFDYRLQGIVPIVAHPERNAGIMRNPELAIEYVKMGGFLQVTNSAITGALGESLKKLSERLIKANLVSFVASDAHNTTTRPFSTWNGVVEALELLHGEESNWTPADLTTHNPGKVCHNEPLPAIDVTPEFEDRARAILSGEKNLSFQKRKRRFFFL